MEFAEISRAVADGAELESGASLEDWGCWLALRALLGAYQDGCISQDHASQQKRELEHAFQRQTHEKAQQEAMYAQYQYNIRLAQQEIVRLCKGKNAGMEPERLLETAIRCIARLTENRAILNHFGIYPGEN